MNERALSLRLAVPTIVLYGAGYPLGAAAVSVMSPFLVILLRFVASALIAWSVIAVRRTSLPPLRQLGHAAVAGILTQAVQFLCLYWALSNHVSAGLGALIIALNPVATSLVLILAFGHRESLRGVTALVLGVIAVVLACAPKLLADHSAGPALIAVIVAMLGLAVGGIYQGRRCRGIDPWVMTAVGITASSPVALVATLATPVHCIDWPRALSLLAAMVVLSSVGATTLYAACIRRSGARAASILFAAIPSSAAVLSWIFLDERLSPLSLIALAMGAAACLVQSAGGARENPVATGRTRFHAPGPGASATYYAGRRRRPLATRRS